MEAYQAYIPIDRRHALEHGQDLPEHTIGAALFTDISGFTALTEALVNALGPQRGAEVGRPRGACDRRTGRRRLDNERGRRAGRGRPERGRQSAGPHGWGLTGAARRKLNFTL